MKIKPCPFCHEKMEFPNCSVCGYSMPVALCVEVADVIQAHNEFSDAKASIDFTKSVADGDCAYRDGCPKFGSRHGQCAACAAREALGISYADWIVQL